MTNNPTRILILGSTGSIGTSACNCVRRFGDRFCVAGLAAGNNADLLAEQIREFSPASIYITGPQKASAIRDQFKNINTYCGDDGLERIVNEADYDILLNALVGAVGFRPTVAALKRGKRVALANKESLVIGGDYIRTIIGRDNGRRLLPVDSEHSAILQCLPTDSSLHGAIESIILTASGGPFRSLPKEAFASITPEQALNHPTWSMGKKITIDSSTLMNKGFELIEAHHLFDAPYTKLRVSVHPQSIIHSMVEFHDGAVLAQLGMPNMELPIQYALSWPERLPINEKRLNLSDIRNLEFFDPDMDKFPCLKLCIDAGETGGTAPAVINAANEVAVDLFLNRRIAYTGIAEIVESALTEHTPLKADSVEVIEDADRETRRKIINKYK
ncbi:MAG: 1-deoxy-D-xylulose-5-phosphate reductoisomerase [Chitinispirillia bacterium]|nr:1-deoxy-D-xylulose-5-phosphate reductoisomerase [Chitinispirillia bacterium]MCL2267574.1 1-deoxy-D-xylulose-5-phosphate reductoisomerase [Chitinispirillia bacterium]